MKGAWTGTSQVLVKGWDPYLAFTECWSFLCCFPTVENPAGGRSENVFILCCFFYFKALLSFQYWSGNIFPELDITDKLINTSDLI